ncbi:MAG: hypothetical protein JNK25_05245 [Phycisphaerae bacterium]|nr:hypothetical protein [Phycisphaerae bacterium]
MPPEQILQMLLWGAAAPFAVAAASAFMLGRRADSSSGPARSVIAGVLAFVITYGVAQGLLIGWPTIPPREAIQYLPLAAVLGALIGFLDLWIPLLRTRWAAVAVIAFAFVLPRIVPMSGKAAWLSDALLAWAILWTSMREIVKSPTRFVPVVTLGLIAACSAVALAGSGSLKLAQLAGIVAFASLGICAAQFMRLTVLLSGPAVGASTAVLASVLGQGVAFGSTPQASAAIIALSAAVAMPAAFLGTVKSVDRTRVALVGAVVLLFAGAGAAFAIVYGRSPAFGTEY